MSGGCASAESRVVTAGFIPLLDCALLAVAHEKGFAESNGIRLRLVREVSWANVRDRLAFGHFDAAHMLGPMVLASNLLGASSDAQLVAVASLGLGGNAITVSRLLWGVMEQHGATLGGAPQQQAAALAHAVAERQRAGSSPLTLAMVFPFSCHNYQLRDWLVAGGIDPDRDVRLVVVPPPMLVEALRTGQVDGFCVGEPWNSLAVDTGLGVIAAVASDIWPNPPEKVLGLRRDYLDRHPETCRALVRSVVEAARWAGDVANRDELVGLLAQPRYVGAPEGLLRAALAGQLVPMKGRPPIAFAGFIQLDAQSTRPRRQHAQMLAEQMLRWGQVACESQDIERAVASYREELHAEAVNETLIPARACPG